jgi:hypothetical protein
LVTGLLIIIGFSLYIFMEPGPSSPKSGTKIQPVKKIILSMPAEQSFSTNVQAKLPVANTTKTITNNMSPTIKYVVLSANLPLDSSVTYDKNTTSQGISFTRCGPKY